MRAGQATHTLAEIGPRLPTLATTVALVSTHIAAAPGEIAETVLLPGDPLRAEWIATTYLDDVSCYSRVRNMLGLTGTYHDQRISVPGTGMGQPSLAIYVHELLTDYGARTLVRVGSCGALVANRCTSVRSCRPICTTSDSLVTGAHTSVEERERTFAAMAELALATVTR